MQNKQARTTLNKTYLSKQLMTNVVTCIITRTTQDDVLSGSIYIRYVQKNLATYKSGIFVSKRHCRLSWKFRFTAAHGNLQATPKTAVNCQKLTWALLGCCPPHFPPHPNSRGGFNM